MPGKAILHREPQLLEPQQPDGIGHPPLQFATDLLIEPAVDDGQTVHKGIHGLTPIDGCIDRVTRRTGDMGEAVVAPGTPDAVRHHDPREDRQRGPARRAYLGEGRGGFKSDAAGRGADRCPLGPANIAEGKDRSAVNAVVSCNNSLRGSWHEKAAYQSPKCFQYEADFTSTT